VKQQLERAAQHLGDAILNAWIEAGSPAPQKNYLIIGETQPESLAP